MNPQRHPNMDQRPPGESRKTIFVERPSEFECKFEEFLSSIGNMKIVGFNCKYDDPPDGAKGKSKSARQAARRRRNKRLLTERLRYGENSYQGSSVPQWDAGDHGTTAWTDGASTWNGTAENDQNGVDEDNDNENEDAMSDEDEPTPEMTEEDVCELARQKNLELGKIALVSISSVNGVSLLIRTCHFVSLPDKLAKFLEGKEFLKIGFGIQGDKNRVYDKYGFFVLNFVDPRRPLHAWKNFVDGYHFERFGVYSVASYLFDREIQNNDAAACLSSVWTAPELSFYLKRAASRETQLTIDVYAEMCVQMFGRRPPGFSLTPKVVADPTFYQDLLKVAEGHINNGFNMRDFGVKVFGTPAMQRRLNGKLASAEALREAAMNRDAVPETFADRVRLRHSKSTIDKYWKSQILYAAFDGSLFRNGPSQPVVLERKLDNIVWEMKLEVVFKAGSRVNVEAAMPAVGYYQKEDNGKDETQAEAMMAREEENREEVDEEWQTKVQAEDGQNGNAYVYQNGFQYEYVQAQSMETIGLVEPLQSEEELASYVNYAASEYFATLQNFYAPLEDVVEQQQQQVMLQQEYSIPVTSVEIPFGNIGISNHGISMPTVGGRGHLFGNSDEATMVPPLQARGHGRGMINRQRDNEVQSTIAVQHLGRGVGRGQGHVVPETNFNGWSAMALPKSRGPR